MSDLEGTMRGAKLSRFGQYEGYSKATYDGYLRRSDYLTLRDGTELAYDIMLPTRGGTPAADTLPTLLMHTPYLRAMKIIDDGKILLEDLFNLSWMARWVLQLRARFARGGQIADVVFRERWLKRLLHHGYAVVVVERSGTGASSGVISASFEEVAHEADEILNWIAAQPWCDGNIGMLGTSMVAMAQYAAASACNSHLKAIMPCASGFDMYSSVIYPGGVYCSGFSGVLSGSTGVLERMIVPVDSDAEGAHLAEILKERGERRLSDVAARGFRKAPFRDSRSPHPRGGRLWEDQGLYNLLGRVNASGVAVYNSAGWYDLFSRDGFLWHANLTTPRRLHVRPLFHNRMGKPQRDLDYGAEVHRWFDYWLKGIDNGIMDEPPVRYYVMGVRGSDVWRSADGWPPAGYQTQRFYLTRGRTGSKASAAAAGVDDGSLDKQPPTELDAFDTYTVDYSTTSGPNARWSAVTKGGWYADWINDEKGLTYTTQPLERAVEITGHPIVHLWISTEAPDLDLFVYLELVAPDGRAGYVTEGNLRASHRALGKAPFDNLGLPYHRSYEEDVAPMPVGEPVELVFDLLPTSRLYPRGSRIRLTIACADAGNFETPILNPAPEIYLQHNARHASFIDLTLRPVD